MGSFVTSLPTAARNRISDADEHPRRQFILDYLEREGPTPARNLIVAGHMSRSSFLHHARNLALRRLVTHRLVGRHWVYAKADQSGIAAQASPLPSERAQRVLEIAKANPGARQKEIAEKAGVTQSYVSRVLHARPRTSEPQPEERPMASGSRFGTSTVAMFPDALS